MANNFKMTTKEVCEDMRRRGNKIGEPALRQGIELGLYPFGMLVSTGKTGRRVFLIRMQSWKSFAGRMKKASPLRAGTTPSTRLPSSSEKWKEEFAGRSAKSW